MSRPPLKNILEAALMAAGEPLSLERMQSLFDTHEQPKSNELKQALTELKHDLLGRGVELSEVASGYRMQVRTEVASWVARLWDDKPQRYSRALLETLALIAYRQPITRGDIEDVRGVVVSSQMMKTLIERDWVRIVGYRDVPGRPAMYATTKEFLDYFNLKSLDDLPSLMEIRELEDANRKLELGEDAEARKETPKEYDFTSEEDKAQRGASVLEATEDDLAKAAALVDRVEANVFARPDDDDDENADKPQDLGDLLKRLEAAEQDRPEEELAQLRGEVEEAEVKESDVEESEVEEGSDNADDQQTAGDGGQSAESADAEAAETEGSEAQESKPEATETASLFDYDPALDRDLNPGADSEDSVSGDSNAEDSEQPKLAAELLEQKREEKEREELLAQQQAIKDALMAQIAAEQGIDVAAVEDAGNAHVDDAENSENTSINEFIARTEEDPLEAQFQQRFSDELADKETEAKREAELEAQLEQELAAEEAEAKREAELEAQLEQELAAEEAEAKREAELEAQLEQELAAEEAEARRVAELEAQLELEAEAQREAELAAAEAEARAEAELEKEQELEREREAEQQRNQISSSAPSLFGDND